MTPADRAAHNAYHRRYYAAHRDELRAYHRDWVRRHRRGLSDRQRALIRKDEAFAAAESTLHSYSCGYPDQGCSCRALVVR